MRLSRLFARRGFFVRVSIRALIAAGLTLVALASGVAAGAFPYDQDLLLETQPMRPLKRVPVLNVSADGTVTVFLWCRTVHGRVQLADNAIRIEPGPLPTGLPRYMIAGQCTPARMDADLATLTALVQVTAWRKRGSVVMLSGPTVLRFRVSSH